VRFVPLIEFPQSAAGVHPIDLAAHRGNLVSSGFIDLLIGPDPGAEKRVTATARELKMTQWAVTSPEDIAVLDEVNSGASDRAIGIIAASLVEIHLTKLLKKAFISEKRTGNKESRWSPRLRWSSFSETRSQKSDLKGRSRPFVSIPCNAGSGNVGSRQRTGATKERSR
jgi:hypothetical protein